MLILILTSKDPKVTNKRYLQKFTPQHLQHSEQLLQPLTPQRPTYTAVCPSAATVKKLRKCSKVIFVLKDRGETMGCQQEEQEVEVQLYKP